ncbi:host-nuclease inhibitor Gam family protein [Anaerosalibacter sp. Marseille-P3206]|uniref:host-nuclease inhibitor Gam family protein n=1 Tax=Anaerosalibacter sp. Marseille-P3206 TaxID=1871005 RepID=UPI000985467B|nr:host-nuclease inhibitor Gam family protein [Anaerosalibacter sp. Marseille-P3206]
MDKMTEMEIMEVENIEEEEKERFKIQDVEQVNWAFRKIKAFQSEINQTNELADKELERIEIWRKKENETARNSIEFFQGLIIEYFAEMKKKDPKYKISTPYGKVSTRKQQPKWNYDDEKLVEWLEHYKPELVRVKKEINKTDFKKAVKDEDGFIAIGDGKVASSETGEVIEGVTIEERPETINIKVVE